MMDKTFDPAAVEGRVAALWREADAFRSGRADRAAAPPFSIVIPPPNVTGSLHMGHALNATLQDVLARYRRMRGDDVLWQPGMDHAGIATQMVVERQLAEKGEPGRRDLGRAKFLERVWTWKAASGGAIAEQLQRIGASCDWSRERFTMDEGLSAAVVKVFVQLHREGLIYRDKRLVNWDPKLLTAISDLEVVQVETKGFLWRFKYPLVDGDGRETGEFVTVATTRPETMLGDTGIAVNPADERYLRLHGARARLPLVGRLIPIVADDYSDPEKGTGAVKITPAHDFNDFEVGRRHGLGLINVLDAEAKLTLAGNEAFAQGAAPDPDILALDGLSREAAREKVVALMEARGLLEGVDPHPHMVPHGDRSNAVIEPWLTDQWYVDAKTLAGPALAAVREGKTVFHPKNWEKTYFDWLENIEPWCVSRQLWWGHQIPAWYGPDGKAFVAASEAEALEAAKAHYGAPTALTRDEDVLDTWFSSALWPFSTLGWPQETPELARYYPTSVLVTGFDIIFFWVARMMMMSLHFMGEVPFRDVYLHALVRDARGAKMSKSKGNVIDPLELIDQYGADALRFTMAAMAAQGRDVKLAKERVEGYRNFATKIWNAARFAEINGCALVDGFDPRGVKETLNAWILGEAAKACAETAAAIEGYRFNDAANAAYRFVWNVFCDWHLELAKPLLQGEDGAAKDETRATTAFVFDQILKLLHPFMPFLTEELWAVKAPPGRPRASVLALAAWPDLAGLEAPRAEAEIGWLIELISEIRSVRSEMNAPAGAQIPLVLVAAAAEVEARARLWDETLRRLARLSGVSFAAEAPGEAAQFIVRGAAAALPLAGVIDFSAEKARLAKEIGKCGAEAKKIAAKLANADFVARAPEE
ncbi:valine--tRNA ligase, partial [Methylocella sp.]|uniref:valine--tRNA ligase n=1 Tax=Methylocella sp. TaxID=1978226 RepID=UPI003784944E